MTQCYIAYIHNAGQTPDMVVVKIGFSNRPEKRFAELSAMGWLSPAWMEFAKEAYEDGKTIESALHEALKRYRIHHEWFHVPWGELDVAKAKINSQYGGFWEVVPVGRFEDDIANLPPIGEEMR